MVLHDISDNPVMVKVSTTTKCSKGFFECNLYASNAVSIPRWTKEHVAKPQADEVLHHLLPQVVVNPVQLLLSEEIL